MIVLDTCAIIFDALSPEKLSPAAKRAITNAETTNNIFCSDISLWEIAVLIRKKRLNPGIDTQSFLQTMLLARKIQVLNIIPEIAALSEDDTYFNHFDPADRLIAATAIHYQAELVTCDKKLQEISDLKIIW